MVNLLQSLKNRSRLFFRISKWGRRPATYHYQKVERALGNVKDPPKPWQSILLVADLRPTDRVLDMGCAEGLISLEVAKHVAHVDGVEIDPARVQEAGRIAAQRNVANASFAAGSVVDYPLEPLKYDLTLLLNVLDKVDGSGRVVGLLELQRMLAATRRQIIVRYSVQRSPHDRSIPLPKVLSTMDEFGFDGICFGKHTFNNMIVGNRRGTDARLRAVPPFVVLPTESMRGHPCIGDARIGTYDEFP